MLPAVACAAFLLAGLSVAPARADQDLAKQSQNPLGTVISLPFENNLLAGIGPSETTAYLLNMKPVYPVNMGAVNLINRLTVPVIYSPGQDGPVPPDLRFDLPSGQSGIAQGSAFGLSDTTYQAFFGPAAPGAVIWGAGPALVLPTATEDRYASDKWSAGPAVVALATPGRWVAGVLAQNVWSFAGDSSAGDVNKLVFQYFLNYNLAGGWYLSSTPVLTANWEAASDNRWTVPVGGGGGRLVRFGEQPVDFKLVAYYNVERPQFAPDWTLQFQVKFLFPK